MKIKSVKDEISKYLKKHQLEKKFLKAKELFEPRAIRDWIYGQVSGKL